jgi:hypothetical protein
MPILSSRLDPYAMQTQDIVAARAAANLFNFAATPNGIEGLAERGKTTFAEAA